MKTSSTLRFAAAAFAAIAAIACSEDDTAQPGNPDSSEPFTITASIDDGADTRVSMTDDGATKIEVKWQPGDHIFVANEGSTSATKFTIVAESISADGKTAAFQAPAGYTGTPQYAVHKGSNYVPTIDPTNLNAGYLNQFESSAGSYYMTNAFTLYARYDAATGQFAFRPLAAILKLDITLPEGASGAATHIRIASTDGSNVFYNSTYYNITGESPVRTSNSLTDEFLVSGSTSMTAGTKKSLYLPIHPGTELLGKQLEISMVVGTGVYTATITGGTLQAGKCYPLTLGAAKWTHFGNVAEEGTGTLADPYLVRTELNLRTLAKAVLTGQTYLTYPSSIYFRLDNPVALTTTSEQPWYPIGTTKRSFSGNFDGNNQTISGDIHLSDKDGFYLGLFGYVYEGSVSRLTVNGNIIYNGSQTPTRLAIGGIGGRIQSTLTDCKYIGTMTLENTVITGSTQVGGITGYHTHEISGCTQQGTITVNMPQAKDIVVGGIVGELNIYTSTTKGIMHTCTSASNIIVTGKAYSADAGTLVGFNGSAVYDCSTAQSGLTVTVNGVEQNPPKAVGSGNQPVPCDIPEHTAQQ